MSRDERMALAIPVEHHYDPVVGCDEFSAAVAEWIRSEPTLRGLYHTIEWCHGGAWCSRMAHPADVECSPRVAESMFHGVVRLIDFGSPSHVDGPAVQMELAL